HLLQPGQAPLSQNRSLCSHGPGRYHSGASMSLTAWVPDEVIPAAKLNEPVNMLNAMGDNGLSYASMFQRAHLQKLAIASPQDGYYLFNTATERPQIFINGRWYEFQLTQADFD